jgi:hypothetical protein
MKKIIVVSFCFLFSLGMIFAQDTGAAKAAEPAKTAPTTSTTTTTTETTTDTATDKQFDSKTVKEIIPQNQHTTDKTASVKIEYTPMYDEARIYYSCMYVTYDKGEAMNTVIACIEDFMKENQYYHYTYLRRDRESYFKNERGYNMAQYMSYVKFTR